MAEQQDERSTVWVRWGITLIIVVAVNFISVGYFVGGTESKVNQNVKRLEKLESEQVTREQLQEIKSDIREIKVDVKELNKRR